MTEEEARHILGVDTNATEGDVTSAFRRLAENKGVDKLYWNDPLYDEKLAEWEGIKQARDILLGRVPASEPNCRSGPDSEATEELRLFPEPSAVDFGTIQEGDEPDPVVINVYCHGTGPYEVDDVAPPLAAWWQIDRDSSSLASEDERLDGLLARIVFVAPIAPRLKPETYGGDHQITVAGAIVSLPVRLKVTSVSSYTASRWTTPTASPRPHTTPKARSGSRK